MRATIVRIEHAGPGSRARRLVFDEDLPSRLTSNAVIKQLGLSEGTVVDASELETRLKEVEFPLAKDRALLLLGYREHSASELRKKLFDAGYPDAACRAVVARFQEIELVDDHRFANAWVRSRRAAGYGARRIARDLELRGIGEDMIRTALDEAGDGTDEADRARAALRGKQPHDRASRERLLRRLITRGFSMSAALKALDLEEPDGYEP